MKQIITKVIETKLGSMTAGVTIENKLCLLEFNEPARLSRTISKLEKKYKYELIEGNGELLDETENQLNQYFDGSLKQFNLPLFMIGTDFEKQVWSELLKIPYSETRSYLQIAKLVNNPTGFRAVARANGSNNISIIIPCHRVIASNGNLQGYGGGLWRKDIMLRLEKRQISINEKIINQTITKKQFKLLENWIS